MRSWLLRSLVGKLPRTGKRCDVNHSVDDVIRAKPLIWSGGTLKFEIKWLSSFRSVKRTGPIRYELDLPGIVNSWCSQFSFVEFLGAGEPPTPADLPDGSIKLEMESNIADRLRTDKTQYLVKCLVMGPEAKKSLPQSDLLHGHDAVKHYLQYSVAVQAAQPHKAVRIRAETNQLLELLKQEVLLWSKPLRYTICLYSRLPL